MSNLKAKATSVPLRNLWIALGLLVVGLIATALAVFYIKAYVEAAAQREFDFTCNEIQINIAERLDDSAQVLRSGAALFDASEMVTREQWRIFTHSLQIEQRLPGIQGIGFSLLIPPEQLTQHIESMRGEGFPEYQVTPAGEREIYSAIIYLEPFSDRNLRAFGYDMFSEAVRRAAMELARDENIAALSGKVILVQETDQDIQAGALMYVPVYRHGLPIDTIEQRRAAIMGWVYSPYRMADLMRGVLRDWDAKEKDRQIYLQVYDGDVISTDTLLYDSQSDGDKVFASTASVTKVMPVDFDGQRWTLRFTQLGGLASTADYSSVWLVLFGGMIISLLLFWLTLSLLNTRVNARRMADQLTTELRESEEKYGVVFHNDVYAICIFDLETLKLLDVNDAYVRLYGYSREELLSGMTVHDITAEQQASDSAIAQATRAGTTIIPTRYHRKKDGTVFPIELVAGAYVWQGRKVMFVLAHNITERKLAELSYRSLFNQTHDAIFILNLAGRHIMFNQRACDMLGYTLDELQQLSVDDTSAQLEESRQVIERLVRGELVPLYERVFRRKDGSLLPVEINVELVRDANGKPLHIQSMVRDITERRQAEEALRRAQDELETAHRELQQSFAREQQLARTDELTGVNSRGYLFELAAHEFEVAMRYRPPLCMFMIDIDDFKQINDTFGHAIGDQAIQHISKIIRAEIRSADVIGRYGAGDEFIILLPQTSAQEALPLAERIHASVTAMRLDTDRGALTLSVSIGIAQTIHDAAQTDTVENLFLRADQAMYAAKQAGKNCTVIGE